MPDPQPPTDARRLYDLALDMAYGHAARHVAWDAAFEVAHDVASDMVQRFTATAETPEIRSVNAWVNRAVRNRLHDLWRAGKRRAIAEGVHQQERGGPSGWSQPGLDLEASELARVVDEALAAMPEAMRAVFVLVRREELSYRDAADRLGIAVGTVHTQLSRANARLRTAVARYRAEVDGHVASPTQSSNIANGKP